MTPDYTNARSADGPTVVAWLAERIHIGPSRDPWAAVIWSWNAPGRLVGIDVVDEWLTPIGIHLSELPTDCWRWTSQRCPCQWREASEQAISEWLDGTPANSLISRYGVGRDRFRGWIRGLQHLAQSQQTDGHGSPISLPDRSPGERSNGQSRRRQSSPVAASAASLEGVGV